MPKKPRDICYWVRPVTGGMSAIVISLLQPFPFISVNLPVFRVPSIRLTRARLSFANSFQMCSDCFVENTKSILARNATPRTTANDGHEVFTGDLLMHRSLVNVIGPYLALVVLAK
ncbi:hypothetical protein BD769DRAFT_1679835 [Suillus cothurnatus]|nr:hypothetical protein BD769DRAFT_1679835 [Suillus cothurnatus]